jgi:hypothetical protein
MKDLGATELYSRNLSRDAFNTRVAIFGPDKLSYYYTEKHREAGISGPAPVDTEEARVVLEDVYARAGDVSDIPRSDAPATFGVRVDLTDVDAHAWEKPLPAQISAKHVKYVDLATRSSEAGQEGSRSADNSPSSDHELAA